MSQKHSARAIKAVEEIFLMTPWIRESQRDRAATIIDREAVQPAVKDLLEAAKDFVNKVETGRARSKDSYAKFKAAIAKAEITT